jgi:hypothetical protein
VRRPAGDVESGRRIDWIRVVAVGFVVVTLLALSFVLGRTTMGHVAHETTNNEPAVVGPVVPPVAVAPADCHIGRPC